MFKVIKVYLKNSKDVQDQEIYCIRLNFNEGLSDLKNKVFMRSPRTSNQEPHIYWFDLENDKIVIACDDDLKFFMEESPCHKVIFDFNSSDSESRKRSCSSLMDETSECSKRIRKQLQNIDMSSDSSSMETDDDEVEAASTSFESSKNSSSSDVGKEAQEVDAPAQSQSPKVTILSVDIIAPSQEETALIEAIEIPDENGNNREVEESNADEVQIVGVEESETQKAESSTQIETAPKKSNEPNRIVISDSSDEDDTTNNNRRHSDGPYSSAYSFTNVNGNTYESRASFSGGRHHHSHRFRRNHHPHHHHTSYRNFQEQARQFQEQAQGFQEQMHEHARVATEQAARVVRASTSAIPDLVSTFQAHFRRPMFRVSDLNQQLFGSFGRR